MVMNLYARTWPVLVSAQGVSTEEVLSTRGQIKQG